jgi:uncharacterized repeat protein (TIGR03803 family)
MNSHIKQRLLLTALIASLGLQPPGRAAAQAFTNLHVFTATAGPGLTNSDGVNPNGGLLLSGNILYGTAPNGGSAGAGTVFAINTDGSGFTNLYNAASPLTINPAGGVTLSGNTLYGATSAGGPAHRGNVFKVNTDGLASASVYNFTNTGLASPNGGMILSGDTLYGTTFQGGNGSSSDGTVFVVNTNGTGYTNLHRFTPNAYSSEGGFPYAGLVLSGNTLYGTASQGGSAGNGTVFAVSTNGTAFTNLHSFTALDAGTLTTNSDGIQPHAGLVLSGNKLYGTATSGGASGSGTVFALNADGTAFTNLHSFTALAGAGITAGTNSDGAIPYGGLVLSGNTLYGTAANGGASGSGTVFALNTDGTGFTNLYSFAAPSDGSSSATNRDGANPTGQLILSGNALYGTTRAGGPFGKGTVFRYLLPVPPPPPPAPLTIASAGNEVVLFWPAWATNYILQSTTNLASPNWVNASDAVPVIAVTISNASPARFFRLQPPP